MITTTNLTKSEIFTAYNKARAAARHDGDKKLIDRLNKALGILQSKHYYHDERIAYLPTTSDRGCKDWQFRHSNKRGYSGACKHMLAEMLFVEIMEERTGLEVTTWLSTSQNVNSYQMEKELK